MKIRHRTANLKNNADGQTYEVIKEDNVSLLHEYDDFHRLKHISVSDTNAANPIDGTTEQVFQYDSLGQLLQTTDDNTPFSHPAADTLVTARQAYDTLGRTIEESTQVGSAGTAHVTTRHFAGPRLARLVYPDGREIAYTYHDSGAIHQIGDYDYATDTTTLTATYEYIGNRTLQRNFSNGVELNMANGTGLYYNNLGLPTTWKHVSTNQSNQVTAGFEYAYDRTGNKEYEKLLHFASDQNDFGYDSANRLVSFERDTAIMGEMTTADNRRVAKIKVTVPGVPFGHPPWSLALY